MLGTNLHNRPAKPFLGVRFVLVGFDSINEPKIRFKLIDGGGVEAGQYGPNCTHVIVDNVVYDDPICIAARKDRKTLVTALWVVHSYDSGNAVDFTSIMYRPLKDLNGIPGAKSLVICLTGYQRLDRDDIMTLVGLMGAQFSKPLVANKVTHLICYKFEGEKYELGKKLLHIKLVNHRWLEDCLREWKILPEANYNKSSYELEMMEAEAKDSEDEAEGTFPKKFAEENVEKSPCNLKPLTGSNTKDKLPVQEIDHSSDQTSTYDELSHHHYQSPFRKHAKNDLTPNSRSFERPPHSDGKVNAAIYSRKTPRSLGELSSNRGGLDKEISAKPKVDNLLSSLLNPDQAKDAGASNYFESPKKVNDLLSAEGPTVCLPQKSTWTGSYGSPYLQKTGNDVKPCFRKSPSPSDKTPGVKTFFDDFYDTSFSQDAIGNKISLNEGANNADSAIDHHLTDMINQSSFSTKLSTPEPLSKAKTSESMQHFNGNEKTSLLSLERLKMSPISRVPGSSNFDVGNSTPMDADKREPQVHQQDVKGSAGSNRNPKTSGPSGLNLAGNDNAVTKPLRKKMVAKKTLGSRPKIASKANEKGSICMDNMSTFQKDSATVNNEAAKEAETLDDETETPEERVEPVLKNLIDQKNYAAIELTSETNILKDEDTVMKDLSNNVTANTCEMAVKEGLAEDALENAAGDDISAPAKVKSKGDGLKRKNARQKAPAGSETKAKKVDVAEAIEPKLNTRNETNEVKQMEKEKKAVTGPAAKSKNRNASKNKSEKSEEEEKENKPIDRGAEHKSQPKRDTKKHAAKSDVEPLNIEQSSLKRSSPSSSEKVRRFTDGERNEPVLFILSGHRFQRKEFQKVIRHLKGRFCRDSHQWSYQATHFIVPDPIRRTEKFLAAAASGRWILKTDYLTASNEAGKFLAEEAYEWHKNGLSEDGAINLEAPRKWRLLRERTGHGAFYGMRVIVYGECIAPPLDTLKRAVKAGDGTILATSPPYTRFLDSGTDFAIVSPGMPRVDVWVQEFLKHEIPCVAADYLVEYVCKPGYSLEKHVLYNSHKWAKKSFARLQAIAEEVVMDLSPPDSCGSKDDVPCKVCGSRNREEVMLICGDESGSRGCGIGCHIDCCDPPLKHIPKDDWFCSDCSNIGKIGDKSPKKRKLKNK